MAEQKSSTQEAAASVVNKINAGSQNVTTANPTTVANAPGNQAPSNLSLQLPPALANGGSKK